MMKSKYENLKIIYNRHKLGWYWAPVFVAFWFILFYVTVIPSFHLFPKTLTIDDEPSNPTRFIGQRAEATLLNMTRLGPKVVGSAANEQAAVNFLLNEITKIKRSAELNIYEFEQDVQVATGSYVLWDMVNMYQGIQNVVVKIRRKDSNSTACLLLNSHYDSVPESSGAGDAGIMIIIMLEILRVITKNDTPLQHCVIFLFNGAEENPLQGSHAFITGHTWAKYAKALINLDSAGTGGREILFQSGPDHPWLMKYYGRHIQHPYAMTMAEELFQHKFIPSDTDFRIFRDYGHIPGFDLAHSFNGYVYHTRYDKFNRIPRDTYQLTGDNILELTKALANAPELEDPSQHSVGHTIFFDVLGLGIIYYTEDIGFILNISVSVFALIVIALYLWLLPKYIGIRRSRTFLHFGIIFGIQLLSIIIAIGFTIGIAVLLDAIGLSMTWFYNTWLVFGLYFCPIFFWLGILPAIYLQRTKEYGIPLGNAIQLFMHAHCLILTVVLIIMMAFNIRSCFAIMISILFYSVSVLINLITSFHRKSFLWVIPHLLFQIAPYIFFTYLCYAFYTTFIPLQGRDGADENPELLISGATILLNLLFAPFLIPVLCLFRKTKTLISIFAGIFLLFFILAATPVGFPYVAETAPQRFYVVHTTQKFHSTDMSVRKEGSGFYVVPVDRRYDSLTEFLSQRNLTKSKNTDCLSELMCGYPIYNARWLGWMNHSFWLPAPAPLPVGIPTMKILSKRAQSSTRIQFIIEISGPDHMGLFIQPLEYTNLVDWSFNKEPLERKISPPYFIYFSYGTDNTPLRFTLEFERNSPYWTGPTFDLAVIGHLVHHDIHHTNIFRDFLKSFPKWVYAASWTSSYESWRL